MCLQEQNDRTGYGRRIAGMLKQEEEKAFTEAQHRVCLTLNRNFMH